MRVIFAPAATRDLQDIADWIARDSRPAARRFVARLKEASRSLADFPERHPIDERTGLRRRTEGAYLIYYRVTDHVEIARVLHAAQNWPDQA